ncbi:MAG: sodium:solute symporter family protein [Planctomycetota bacterium]|jgi:SSS family transporter
MKSNTTAKLMICSLLLLSILVVPVQGERREVLNWSQLAELSPIEGQVIQPGLAGAFCGIHNDALIIAGGANFPNGPPWEGGGKVWHSDIYVLEKTGTDQYQWHTESKLDSASAYGASVSCDRGLICIGGCDSSRCYNDVFLLKWNSATKKVEIKDLPSLPKPCAFTYSTKIGNTIFVAGGQSSMAEAAAMDNFWSLDMSVNRQWETLPSWDGPERILPVLAAQHDGVSEKVYLFSGRDVAPDKETQLLKDAYRYDPSVRTWTRLSDTPRCFMAGMGVAFGAHHILLVGGDDGRYWGQDLRDTHPGFPKDMLFAYHTITDTWVQAGTLPENHVTTVLAKWDKTFVIPSGEIRPAVCSPKVWQAVPHEVQQKFAASDYLVLGLYMLSLIAMGFYFSKREKTTQDFFLAGRRIPWWAAGLSIFGTQLSAITFMAIPAKAYATDWVNFLFNMGILAITPLVILCFLPFYRRLNVTTAYEYLERRFNLVVRLLGSALFIIFQFGRIAIVLLLPSLALSVVTGINVYACILTMGMLATIYTVMGGIEAVIWTDVLQVIVLVGGALVCLILVAFSIDGSIARIFTIALEDGKLHCANWNLDFTTLTIWVIVLAWANHLISYTTDQTVIQRYLTTKDERASRSAIWTNAFLTVPASLLFFAMGTALYVFYKSHPENLNPSMEKADMIFPWYIMNELPAGLSGLVIAGVFAASMSSLDSSMNSMSTAIVTDFYCRFRKGLTEAHHLRVARALTALFGVVATVFAILMASTDIKSLWDQFIFIIGLLGGGLGGLFVLGIFTRRANAHGAVVGLLASGVVQYVLKRHSGLHDFMFAITGMASCVIIGFLASYLFPGGDRSLENLTLFVQRTERNET